MNGGFKRVVWSLQTMPFYGSKDNQMGGVKKLIIKWSAFDNQMTSKRLSNGSQKIIKSKAKDNQFATKR